MDEALKNALDHEARFNLKTALTFAIIPLIPLLFLIYMMWVFMSMTHIFFEANGFLEVDALRTAFFDYIVSDLLETLPFIGAYFCFLFVMGYFFARILVNPIKVVGHYCELKVKDKNVQFSPRLPLVDLKLLTGFSISFFNFIDEVSTKKCYTPRLLEPRYQSIKKPVLDKIYFVHFLILVLIICALSCVGLYVLSVDLHARIIELAISSLSRPSKSLGHFLNSQKDILITVQWATIVLMFVLYLIYSFSLVRRMSEISFSFFKTMCQIMEGKPLSRVFIRGDNPGLVHAICFNQYMDQVFAESEIKNS